ncbi:RNA polymerase sigma factor [Brucella pseudogrignonensis]|uniref:RNA polymerase sigma-70 factor (ECF subfamily) n=1 Tax=Brucella pseudogrignonensis TaxID=419475 RepID=A0ABU1MDC9_9HYPH|nr:RNA polymerase sigma factor [Brucella pseudogrignonensis]MDR6433656.1 RNA polymerase sigma-70 factor (ECF subfamily) [Brucella pseudogrignonensis]
MAGKTLKGLFLAHQRELKAYLTQKLKDSDTAADLTQEAFLRYAEQNSVDGTKVVHARSYLYRTAHNLAVDHVRQKARRKTDTSTHDEMAEIADDRPTQEEAIDARQKLDRLQTAVAELPGRTRQIFVLSRIEGLSYAETADRLGISESSVQKHLAKALLHVTQRLRPQ